LPAPAEATEFEYIGSKNCKKCHLKQYKSWEATKMATAFEVLKPGERSEQKAAAGLDPAADYSIYEICVKCHVTGYGKPGGFVDIETTPELANVGCETCHGPGGSYTTDKLMSLKNKEYKRADLVAAGMVESVGDGQCTGCHNSESPFVEEGYVFDFEANKDTGTHEHFPLKYNHD
jgi:mono/diheme cytochrome c family protein